MPAITCPHCRVLVNVGAGPIAPNPKNDQERFGIGFCMNCQGHIYLLLKPDNEEISHYPVIVATAPTELPPTIRKAFDEALICYSANAPNGALLMCRRALQETMADKAAKKGNLPTQLQDLVDRQIITPQLKSWAEFSQVGGRIAAHGTGGAAWGDPDKIWGDMNDADVVIKYLNSLFDYLYVLDKRHRELLGIPDADPASQSEKGSNEA